MNPRAIYHARVIYNPTNNADYIQYLPQNLIPFINISSLGVLFYPFSFLAAIHLFTRSVTKSKISTSPVKKLVAVTGGVYASIQFYNFAIASVTAGTVCPAAIYGVSTIYNPTNNAVRIKYLAQNQNKFNAYIRFRCYVNIQPPMCLHNIETPPLTSFPISRKTLRKFSYFQPPPTFARNFR